MTKVSVVLYYWILITAVLLFTRIAGLSENNEAVIKILIVSTLLYVGVVLLSRTKGKALEGKSAVKEDAEKTFKAPVKRKKKQR